MQGSYGGASFEAPEDDIRLATSGGGAKSHEVQRGGVNNSVSTQFVVKINGGAFRNQLSVGHC